MKRIIIPLILLVAIIAGLFTMYRSSVNEDFNNISHAEVNRVGENYTGIYHRPACPKIENNTNLTQFADNAEAKAAGYAPCKRCKPNED